MSGSKSSEERQMTPKQAVLKAAEICDEYADAAALGREQEWSRLLARRIRAFAETLPQDGVWVPREPTQEQMIAGAEVKQPNGLISLHGAAAIYQAMLAAVPKGDSNG